MTSGKSLPVVDLGNSGEKEGGNVKVLKVQFFSILHDPNVTQRLGEVGAVHAREGFNIEIMPS